MIISTNIKNVAIRNLRIADAEAYSKHADNYNIWKYSRDEFPHPYTFEHAKKYIGNSVCSNEMISFAIVLNDELIGDIHIAKQTDILRLSGFLGYWLAESFWGKGIMTEAVKTFTNYIFENTELNRIFARVFANNTGSMRVLEKAGYKLEGHFRNAIIKEGIVLDQLQYAILKK